ncbi:Segregation and condensation protein A [Rhodanobacter lindaniclasticus]
MSTEPVVEQSDPGAAVPAAFAAVPQQQEMPLAIVRGEPMLQMPQDLYIPPDALEVILESFEGPLDLLLYLIRRQNLDILDIPVAEITRQYMAYIELMRDVMRLELAADYPLRRSWARSNRACCCHARHWRRGWRKTREPNWCAGCKSTSDSSMPPRTSRRCPPERDSVVVHADNGERDVIRLPPPLELTELLLALKEVMHRAELFGHHAIKREALSVRQRMGELLSRLDAETFHRFEDLFDLAEGRPGIVVTFLCNAGAGQGDADRDRAGSAAGADLRQGQGRPRSPPSCRRTTTSGRQLGAGRIARRMNPSTDPRQPGTRPRIHADRSTQTHHRGRPAGIDPTDDPCTSSATCSTKTRTSVRSRSPRRWNRWPVIAKAAASSWRRLPPASVTRCARTCIRGSRGCGPSDPAATRAPCSRRWR